MSPALRQLLLSLLMLKVNAASAPETRADLDGTVFHGSDQFDFALVLPGSAVRCLWHQAQRSGRFYVTYTVQWVTGLSQDKRLSVSVLSPEGNLVASANDDVATINFEAHVTGFYQVCLHNVHNTFGSMQVFLYFGVQYENSVSLQAERHAELRDTLQHIEERLRKLQGFAFHTRHQYNLAGMRKGTDYYVLLSTSHFVTWWSAAQSMVIIMVSCLQLFVLKGILHFRTKAVSNRPRC